jgi:hypothetical protein
MNVINVIYHYWYEKSRKVAHAAGVLYIGLLLFHLKKWCSGLGCGLDDRNCGSVPDNQEILPSWTC